MNLQYISDSSGKITGVFIPIVDWNELKKKFKEIDLEDISILDWHIEEVRRRLIEFKKNPQQAQDFDTAMDEIEKDI